MRSLPSILLALVLLAACSEAGGAHTFQAGATTVRDASGLVTAVTAGGDAPPTPSADRPAVANPPGQLTNVVVAWLNPGCSRAAMIDLSGNALELIVTQSPSPSGCTSAPHVEAVTMTINRVVDVTSIVTKAG